MMFRLLALILLPVIAWYLVKSVRTRFQLTPRQTSILFVITAVLLAVAVLVVMGRLPLQYILAPVGAVGVFLLRFLPTLLRLLPFWQMLQSRIASASPGNSQQNSTIRTEYLTMELWHHSGDMDGEVLEGTFSGRKLSTLTITELLQLREQCAGDADSLQVLEAYLDRMHDQWRAEGGFEQGTAAVDESPMTRELALEILGLQDGASAEEITRAHRTLMQRLHPDRGGSDYLAKKINLAKDFLLQQNT